MEATVATTKKKKSGKQSPWAQVFKRLRKNKSSMICFYILCFIMLFALTADLFLDSEAVYKQTRERRQPPSSDHWFGTDIYGRDIFTRVVYGARVSLTIGLVAEAVAVLVGGMLGAVGAYYGGKLEELIMRLCDVFAAVPSTLMAMCMVSAFGTTASSLILALSITRMPQYARLMRSSVMTIAGREFVEAAKAAGMSDGKIILTQIIPNTLGTIIVQVSQGIATGILTAASLSYLGLGVQPPNPEWGALISTAREFLRTEPYMSIIPGIVVVITALCFNLVGDGLRDALDPRLKD